LLLSSDTYGHKGSKILTIRPYVSELKSKAAEKNRLRAGCYKKAKEKAFSAVDEYRALDWGTDDEDVPVVIATMCSVDVFSH
jgi:hypothetical protein